MAKHHELNAGADTVHWGYFDAALKPVLKIDSGDTVTLTTISGSPELLPMPGGELKILPEYAEVYARHTYRLGPHIMTGPIYIEGAEPGDTLEVRIKNIQVRQNWGYNLIRPLSGTIPEDFGQTWRAIQIPIDINAQIAYPCRFRNLDSSISMVQSAKDRIRNNVSDPLDRACAGRVLPKRNVSSDFIIVCA